MRIFIVVLCFFGITFCSSAFAEPSTDTAKQVVELTAKDWLKKMSQAVHTANFDASFVVVRGKSAEPYRWLHALHDGVELEHLSVLNGAGLEITRVGDQVTYFEPQTQPYSLKASFISGPIPEVLFQDIEILEKHYRFVLAGKGRIAGRPAQLVRIDAKDSTRFNYWVWLDMASSLLLKAAYVTPEGEAIEQVQITHLSVTETPHIELVEMSKNTFPDPQFANMDVQDEGRWNFSWLPEGFKLLKADRHHLALTRELTDYYLFSDGLVEASVFVQRPLAGARRAGYSSFGATTVFMHKANGFDVSVVGKIPLSTARAIAESVSRPDTQSNNAVKADNVSPNS